MTFLEKMDVPKAVTLKEADWWVIEGLLTKEWGEIQKDPTRLPYYETLTLMRQTIMRRK